MKYTSTLMLAMLMFASVFTAQAAESSAATVNGKPIKQSIVDYIIRDANSRGQKIDDNIKNVIINKLISTELVLQEAQKAGMDKTPDFLAKEELQKNELLVNTYLQDYIKKNPVSDAEVKGTYDKLRQQMGDKEFKAHHILLKTEAEAKDVIAQLSKGGDFEKIAKEKSIDPSKDNGGDLGWFSPSTMVKPFSEAVTKLAKGAVTQTPVQTQFGWHVVRLDDMRDAQAIPFEKVKDNILKQLQQQQIEKLLTELHGKAKIVTPTDKK